MPGRKGCTHKDKMDSEIRLENQREARRRWQRNNKERALELGRKFYHTHPDYVSKKIIHNRKRGLIALQWIREYKNKIGCLYCGEKDYRCLDFHHKDPKDKKRCLSQMHLYSMATIKKEIEKCEVICSNCHRKNFSKKGGENIC